MCENVMQWMWDNAHLSGGNAAYVEELCELYLHDPSAVPEKWRTYFQKPPVDGNPTPDVSYSIVRDHLVLPAKNQHRAQPASTGSVSSEREKKQAEVLHLIHAYRLRGHQVSALDPLGLWQHPTPTDLPISHHGLTSADLDTTFRIGELYTSKEETTLHEIVGSLKGTYCGTPGAEFIHIVDSEQREWFFQHPESVRGRPGLSAEARAHLLERLTTVEGLEKYLGTEYPGTKRFGLEDGESLILMVNEIIQRCGSYGAKGIVIGMAHRSRLNILVNTLGKDPRDLFGEFEGKKIVELSSGDVKYHQGFSSNVMTSDDEVRLVLAFNPFHLKIISPVVEGSARAHQNHRRDGSGDRMIPISIRGDTAFAGQGVVMEAFQMSQIRAYKTGGTIHLVVNSQAGFATSRQGDARSTEYATGVAKVVQAPIFHVNDGDPEAVLFITQLAVDRRMQFERDAVIDLICYRRHGHNEADEPSGTQPLIYQQIAKQRTTRELCADALVNAGVLSAEQVQSKIDDYRDTLDNDLHVVRSLIKEPNRELFVDWRPYLGHAQTARHDVRFDLKTLQELSSEMLKMPEGSMVQRQVSKIYGGRQKVAAGGLPINWGFAETLAYATLLSGGHPVRMTGQDVGRDTFSHRHAVLHNQKDDSVYVSLANLFDGQPRLDICDPFLSEEAVLTFEYGFATTTPNSLVI